MKITLATLFLPLLLIGATPQGPTLLVSIPPQVEAIREIAPSVQVLSILSHTQAPENFSIKPRQMAAFSRACAYVTIGIPLEHTLVPKLKASYPQMQLIDGTQGMKQRPMEHHHADVHRPAGHTDPHVWLDIVQMKQYARNVHALLVSLLPEQKIQLDSNLARYLQKCDDTEKKISEQMASSQGKILLVYHPAFGYFADRYGLQMEALEIEGKAPTAKNLAIFSKRFQHFTGKFLIARPQDNPAQLQLVATALHLTILIINPIPSENYTKDLLKMAQQIKTAL